jgi:hypothetical protein
MSASETTGMRPKPLIAAAGSMKTDGRITELHLWAVHEGLRRTPTTILFEDFCRRLIAAGVPLWRAFAGMRTLHPQWAGYTYTWWRDRNEINPARRIVPRYLAAHSPTERAALQTADIARRRGVIRFRRVSEGERAMQTYDELAKLALFCANQARTSSMKNAAREAWRFGR